MAHQLEKWYHSEAPDASHPVASLLKDSKVISVMKDETAQSIVVFIGDGTDPVLDAKREEALHQFLESDAYPQGN